MATTTTAENNFERIYPTADVGGASETTKPLSWLKKGVKDFTQVPVQSVLYGFIFAMVCGGVFSLINSAPWYSLAYLTGLVFLGPFLAAGLYTAARDIERGNKPTISGSLKLIYQRRSYLTLFSLMLVLVMAAWIRLSSLLFAVKFSVMQPTIGSYTNMLTSPDGWIAMGFFIAIGFVLAAAVFAVSAIAIPYILDRDVNFMSAMLRSYQVVMANLGSMSLWALAIVLLTALGIATAFIAFLVIFPILGYATWHSYRDLVGKAE